MTDADGTRLQLQCKTYQGSNCSAYETTDGSFIRVSGDITGQNPENATFTATRPNGSKVFYFGGRGSGNFRKHFAGILQDSNGNRVRVFYKDNDTGRIDYISDTLNRKIKFYYTTNAAGAAELNAVTIPAADGVNELQTVRFYYADLTLDLNGAFDQNVQVTAPTTSIRVLKYVYMPGTRGGYRYDYHTNYGMIKKITRYAGMTVNNAPAAVVAPDDASLTTSGAVTSDGTWAASTEYAYQSGGLSDVPKYTSRTDDWQGRTTPAAVTDYDSPAAPNPGAGDRQSTVIVHDAGFDVKYTTLSYNTNDWKNGLIKETSVVKDTGSGFPAVLSKTIYTWESNGAIGRQNPRLAKIETTDEAGLSKATAYQYDNYNNQTQIREYGYAASGTLGTLLRTTDIGYETGANWINNNLLGLVKSVAVTVDSAVVSKTLFEYDQYGNNGSEVAPERRNDMDATHDPYYNPQFPSSTETFCPLDNSLESQPNGCVTIYHPGWTAATNYRGNVTKVGRMLDTGAAAMTAANADITAYTYDILGNTTSATLSCCQLKTFDYGANLGVINYAYPVKITKGSSPQLTTEVTYNKPTGQVTQTKDENDQLTNYEYEADTLRQKKTIYPNGGYTLTEYSDKLETTGSVPGFVRTTMTLEANKTVQSYSYFDGRGLGIRSATETPDGWSVSAVEYDKLGRPVKSYNPFYASVPNDGVPAGTKYTEVTNYDAFGRATAVELQDGTSVSTYFSNQSDIPAGFNKTFVRVTDQAGKQRRQVADSLGRIVRVDEPDASGNLGAVDAPTQPTSYEYDANDNLAKVIQSDGTTTQERLFKYDALSRLTHERQVEATATLDANGIKQQSGGVWTKVLKYNIDGPLSEGTDARGVKTTFAYDGLNRVQTVTFSDGTPTITYTYDQERSGFYNKGALTRVETAVGGTQRPDTPTTASEFDYDKMGRVVGHRQNIDAQNYNLAYEYNLAGQLVKEIYPSGREVSVGYDAKGRLASIADASRTYLNGLQFQGNGNSLNSMTLGNGTIQTFEMNDRLQMTNQTLKRNAEILQKYDYGYGQIDASGNLDSTKNNGQLAKVESYIGAAKQWTQKFSYDAIGRLDKSEEYRGDTNALSYRQKFDYDRFGNMYRRQANNPTAGQQSPLPFTPIEDADISKATNRFTSDTIYDDAGNVIQDTQFRQQNFWYDANGRMYKTANTNNINKSNAVYDASGNRVATQVDDVWTFFVYDAYGKKVAEYGGLQATDEGGVKYVLQDHQGSSRAILNGSGYVQARMDYTAFGEEINSGVGQRTTAQGFGANETLNQKYALTERDKATGLDHTWFRKHENRAGRWTSPDPYNGSMSLGNPQSFNRYSYVDNDPMNYVDPSGLFRAGPNTRYGGGILWTVWYGNNKDGWRAIFSWFEPYPSSGGDEEFGGAGGEGEPEIDDQKLKDCLKDLFNTTTKSYEIGKSFRGSSDDARYFFISLLVDIFGGDGGAVNVNTESLSSQQISFKSGGIYGTPGQVPSGWTDYEDPENTYVANDIGNAAFQQSMWVYELGNSLGAQTGNKPKAEDEARRYNNENANDKGGPALVDCVYDGRVDKRGKIIPPSSN